MIPIDEIPDICRVDRSDLEFWIDRVWVRPTRTDHEWHFSEEDVARVELIRDLMHHLDLQAAVELHVIDRVEVRGVAHRQDQRGARALDRDDRVLPRQVLRDQLKHVLIELKVLEIDRREAIMSA